MKQIIVCCDETGNDFGNRNSNVLKLYGTLENQQGVQTAYYHPGVGAAMGGSWTLLKELAFGYGISDNIADAYRFLMNNFDSGDSIFLFGFGRGAYTVRALCGLLHMCGLLMSGNEHMIPYAMRLFKGRTADKFLLAAGFKKTFSRECKPHFLGLWDTVSSVGWVLDPAGLKPGALPYTAQFSDIPIVRHAVSIDERRAFFRQNLVHPLPSDKRQDLKELWFAGVHSDVGGSYPETESGLSKIALQWMLSEAIKAGLLVDAQRSTMMLGGDSRFTRPDPAAPMHDSLTAEWWPAEIWPKRVSIRVSVPGEDGVRYYSALRLNLGRRRYIPEGAHLHASVMARMRQVPTYQPLNLPKEYVVDDSV